VVKGGRSREFRWFVPDRVGRREEISRLDRLPDHFHGGIAEIKVKFGCVYPNPDFIKIGQ
jgi:hypothetical protein